MQRMKVVQVARAGGPFEVVDRPVPEPNAGQVRIKVEAYGICHSDQFEYRISNFEFNPCKVRVSGRDK